MDLKHESQRKLRWIVSHKEVLTFNIQSKLLENIEASTGVKEKHWKFVLTPHTRVERAFKGIESQGY